MNVTEKPTTITAADDEGHRFDVLRCTELELGDKS